MIVSISGKPGSGKSTVAKKLAAALGFKRYYIGGMRREAARAQGMTLADFNKLGEESNITDKKFDDYCRQLGEQEDDFVIESRTAFLFIPHSLKIYLGVSDEVGAQRIWQAIQSGHQPNRNEDISLDGYEKVLISIKERVQSDKIRYRKYYDVDIFDKKHYDLFLDTSSMNAAEEYEKVYSFVKLASSKS
ncbi:cytidylate kinase family protein [Patescibacteria group bacterium]|nr:cytidylate kinase family protein [Patescibacteria group bacterium]